MELSEYFEVVAFAMKTSRWNLKMVLGCARL